MARKETYDLLFRGITESILHNVPSESHAIALCKIVLRSKPAILNEYMAINRAVKAEHMESSEGRIDRHKCAAAFMLAFERRLIVEPDNAQYERYREKIAIIAGLSIMGTLIMAESLVNHNMAMVEYLKKNNGLVMPDLLFDDGPYERNWAIELRKVYYSKGDIGLSVLSLSNELFLIERLGIEIVRGGLV